MRYQVHQRYQSDSWTDMPQFATDCLAEAYHTTLMCACDSICYGMIRLVDAHELRVLVVFGAGDGKSYIPERTLCQQLAQARQEASTWPVWKQTCIGGPVIPYISNNYAKPGSEEYEAEKWILEQGLKVPSRYKHPRTYQGMIDDYRSRHVR